MKACNFVGFAQIDFDCPGIMKINGLGGSYAKSRPPLH